MALTALSITQSVRIAAGFGYGATPPTWYGVLNGTSTSYATGAMLINNVGTLDEAAITTLAGETVVGTLSPVAPRRQDMAVQTSGTAPAAALPDQRTTPSAGAGRYGDNNDPDFVDPRHSVHRPPRHRSKQRYGRSGRW